MEKQRRTDAWLFGDSTPCGSDAATKEADFVEGCLLVDSHHRDICNDGILGKGGGTHLYQGLLRWYTVYVGQTYEVVNGFSVDAEAARVIGHQAFALCGTD